MADDRALVERMLDGDDAAFDAPLFGAQLLAAEHGFRVDAIDLVPAAIEMAEEIAAQCGLSIHFEVADVCELPEEGKQYDLVVDSYCPQCIVFDEERRRIFSAVRSRRKPAGYYLVSTAILDDEHEQLIGTQETRDPDTGVVYSSYGSGLIDLKTGVALRPIGTRWPDCSDVVCIAGRRYLPARRHLRPEALEAELGAAGCEIVFRDEQHAGSVACVLRDRVAQRGAGAGADNLRR